MAFRENMSTAAAIHQQKGHICGSAKGSKAEARTAVRRVLRRRNVKPEHFHLFVTKVMQQAEALYEDWPPTILTSRMFERILVVERTFAAASSVTRWLPRAT